MPWLWRQIFMCSFEKLTPNIWTAVLFDGIKNFLKKFRLSSLFEPKCWSKCLLSVTDSYSDCTNFMVVYFCRACRGMLEPLLLITFCAELTQQLTETGDKVRQLQLENKGKLVHLFLLHLLSSLSDRLCSNWLRTSVHSNFISPTMILRFSRNVFRKFHFTFRSWNPNVLVLWGRKLTSLGLTCSWLVVGSRISVWHVALIVLRCPSSFGLNWIGICSLWGEMKIKQRWKEDMHHSVHLNYRKLAGFKTGHFSLRP